MLKNYIVIALRLIVKNKIFSLINILGLSVGIACCILITLHIQDELNYEKGFPEYKRIFRINTTFIKEGIAEVGAYTSPPIAMELAHTLPEVENAVRVVEALGVEQHIVRYDDKSFFEEQLFSLTRHSSMFSLTNFWKEMLRQRWMLPLMYCSPKN